jgi:iron complex outermembrane receptor protein
MDAGLPSDPGVSADGGAPIDTRAPADAGGTTDAGIPDAPGVQVADAAPSQPESPAAAVSEPASAPDTATPAAANPEIEVTTSRRRAEAVQETPVAVSVISARQLTGAEGAKIQSAGDLSGTVPSFTIDAQPSAAGLVALSIRGISFTDVEKSFDMPIGVVIDGVYVGSNSGINFQNFDLQSVEVLRGPQGTLFGRNTTGGLLNVRTMLPKTDEWSEKIVARGGSFGQADLMGSVNAPIVPNYVGLKLSGSWTNLDGWYTNRSQEFNPASVRSGPEPASHNLDGVADLLVTPTAALSVRLKYEHLRMRGTYGGMSLYPDPAGAWVCNAPKTVGGNPLAPPQPGLSFPQRYCSTTLATASGKTVTLGPYDSIQGWAQNANDADFDMVTGEVNYDLTKQYKVVSVTGWRHSYEFLDLEADAIPQTFADVTRAYHTDQISEELRLHGSPAPTVNFVIGGLAWHSFYDYRSPTENLLQNAVVTGAVPLPPGVSQLVLSSQNTSSFAGFGQGDWEFAKNLRATAGVRYTWEQKDFAWQSGLVPTPDSNDFFRMGSFGGSYLNTTSTHSWSNVSPRAGLDYKLGPSLMGEKNGGLIYGTYSRGFHSGGYNGRATTIAEIGPYNPEYVDQFELGVKTSWARNRFVLNVATFYTIFHDKQEFITQIAPAGSLNPSLTVPENAAQATIKGVEYEVQLSPLRGHGVPLIGNLKLWTTGSVMNAHYDDFKASFGFNPSTMMVNPPGNFAGTPLVRAPDFQTAVGVTLPVDVTSSSRIIADAQLRYRTAMAMSFVVDLGGQARDPLANAPEAHRFDASLTYEMDKIVGTLAGRVTVYGRNLTDQVTWAVLGSARPVDWIASHAPPRSFGVELAINH